MIPVGWIRMGHPFKGLAIPAPVYEVPGCAIPGALFRVGWRSGVSQSSGVYEPGQNKGIG